MCVVFEASSEAVSSGHNKQKVWYSLMIVYLCNFYFAFKYQQNPPQFHPHKSWSLKTIVIKIAYNLPPEYNYQMQ